MTKWSIGVILLLMISLPAQAFCVFNRSAYPLLIDQTHGHKKGMAGIGNKGLRTVKLSKYGKVCRNWKDKNTNQRGDQSAKLRFRITYLHPRQDGPSINIGGAKIPIPTSPPGMSSPSGGGRIPTEKVCEAWVSANGSLTIKGKPGRVKAGRVSKGRWSCETASSEIGDADSQRALVAKRKQQSTYIKPKSKPGNTTPQQPAQRDNTPKIATPQVCRDDYNQCRQGVYDCLTKFKRDYEVCRQDVKRIYQNCKRTKPAPRNNLNSGYGAGSRQFKDHPDCAPYAKVEPHCGSPKATHCGTYGLCDNRFNYCQSKIGPAGGGLLPPLDSIEPKPSDRIQQAPQPKSIRGYRVYIKNSCRQDVSVAYHYQDFNGIWRTRGWQNVAPGKRVWPKGLDTETSKVYIHSTIGRIKQRSGSRLYLPVINKPFRHQRGRALTGQGHRVMPFHEYDWRASVLDVTANIVDCDTHRDQKKSAPKPSSAEVSKKYRDTIFEAAKRRDGKTVRRLINEGVSVNVRNQQRQTLINVLTMMGEYDLVKWLHKKGARLNYIMPDHPASLFEGLPKWGYGGRSIVRYVQGTEMSELLTAAWVGSSPLTMYFADKGQSIKSRLVNHQASLIVAAAFNADIAFLKKMKRDGVKLNRADRAGRNAFHWLMYSPNLVYKKTMPVMTFLHEAGVDLDAKDRNRNTPFHYAVARGYVNQAKWLVEHGADYRIKPGKGMPRELKGLAKSSRSKKMEAYINSLFK